MTAVTRYRCDGCGHEYAAEADARACEASPTGPAPTGRVRLQNRGGRTFTEAVVRSARLERCVDWLGAPSGHRWLLTLDRAVLLDHKWDCPGEPREVPDYHLTDGAGMDRCDNCASGSCRHEPKQRAEEP